MTDKKLATDIMGVILSGGKSERMGTNKSLLRIDGRTLIESIYGIMIQVFEKVIISTNEPEQYDFLKTEKIPDIIKDFGPLSGIHASLNFTKTNRIFVVSSDMPFLITSLIKYLVEVKTEEAIVLPKAENQIQYLCGIYSKDILPVAENILRANLEAKIKNQMIKKSAVSLWNFVDRVGAEIVDIEHKVFYMKDLLFNINTPEDWEYAKERII